jgi:signal transduction histidine kinase
MKPLAPEEATYLRTLFLERVAHELRGPLAVVVGAMQELEHNLGEDAASHRALFAMMKRGVRRLARTADRLQQTGVCERDDLMLEPHRCDLVDLVRWSVDEATTNEGRRNVEVRLELPQGPRYLEVDGRWLSIALYEVASNAIKHAREHVTVVWEEVEGSLRISFIDDSPSARDFEPLRFRPPSEGRGLGLALAIVRDVIAAHGGTLSIERGASESNGGPQTIHAERTCVHVSIPAARREVQSLGAVL